MSSLDSLFGLAPKPAKVPTITIDRSRLQAWRDCALYCKLDSMTERAMKDRADGEPEDSHWDDFEMELCERLFERYAADLIAAHLDRDRNYMRDCGVAFHAVMEAYVTYLHDADLMQESESLEALALAGDARYQPDLLHCAKMAGPRFKLWQAGYISHEKQYAYRMEGFGPLGEDVLLTTKPDLVKYGNTPQELDAPDWKSGWGMGGHDFQAAFVSVVLWRSMDDVRRVTWRPFHARKGQWGKPFEFRDEAEAPWHVTLADAENMIKAAVIEYVQEDEWLPRPGEKHCNWCPFAQACPAPRVCPEIDVDRVAYAEATVVLEKALKARKKLIQADVDARGPIQVDDGFWGYNVLSSRPSFRLQKGTPEYLGEAEVGREGQGDEQS